MRIVLIGPPGAGKGTQATIVSDKLGIPHISTGDIFRANVSEGTDLGRQAKRFMDAGDYVPDELTNAMVRDRICQPDTTAGFLLDGYPRTTSQVAELDDVLSGQGTQLDRVIELTVDVDEVVQRLLARAAEQDRSDDSEDVVRRRLRLFNDQTAPLTASYDQRGLVTRVDGMGSVETVTERILQTLGT